MNKKLTILFILAAVFAGCKKLTIPLDDNHRLLEDTYQDPRFGEGLLMNGYTRLPTNSYNFNDVATDDAVTNDKGTSAFATFQRIGTGQWSALNNPLDRWNNGYTAIVYINKFLVNTDKITWSYLNKNVNQMFNDRMKGEAYALRAYHMYYLLQAHGGVGANGTLLGVPIVTEDLSETSDFKKPRATFEQCIQQIYSDLTESEKYLPLDYNDVTSPAQIPAKYAGFDIVDYNRVFGKVNRQRISANIVKGIRAKAAFLAASPAFSAGTTTNWAKAADFTAQALAITGGVSGIDPQGALWYLAANVDALNVNTGNVDQKEMLWRGINSSQTNTIERDNFPPTLFGNARVNPTQNLVDAFPMANGFPITAAASGYNAANPYAGRDPRLARYIVTNGATMSSKTILSRQESGNDAVDFLPTSTRTGYYMRKLLREDVNLNPASTSSRRHYAVHIRFTELFLNYAEAANEAFGPDGVGTATYSARAVIAAIRKRAGISQPDAYLATITDKDKMRELIKNERRLELCFEGFRFWDLRRWKDPLTEPAKGVLISPTNAFTYRTVENRVYGNHMYYGPLPNAEVLKANLVQNQGY
ncbi:RagB/SusD family nutrient uptake outer membrane protein [Mucilaginibacter calamicampi]|uniref:RagB/SusD family nutrient uptake outer membrane protein n=1 Tax=Mucilaginibacter calamicampi TaxID=1302352 RepID=A0ABW2Z042_9SPHI